MEMLDDDDTLTGPTLLNTWTHPAESMSKKAWLWETSILAALLMNIMLAVTFVMTESLTKAASTSTQLQSLCPEAPAKTRLLMLTLSQFATINSPASMESRLSPEQSL